MPALPAAAGAELYVQRVAKAAALPPESRSKDCAAFLSAHDLLEEAAAVLLPRTGLEADGRGDGEAEASGSEAAHTLALVKWLSAGTGLLRDAESEGLLPDLRQTVQLLLLGRFWLGLGQRVRARAALAAAARAFGPATHSVPLGDARSELAAQDQAFMAARKEHRDEEAPPMTAADEAAAAALAGQLAALQEASAGDWQAHPSFSGQMLSHPSRGPQPQHPVQRWQRALELAEARGSQVLVARVAFKLASLAVDAALRLLQANINPNCTRMSASVIAISPAGALALFERAEAALGAVKPWAPFAWMAELRAARKEAAAVRPHLQVMLQRNREEWSYPAGEQYWTNIRAVYRFEQESGTALHDVHAARAAHAEAGRCDGCGQRAVGVRLCAACKRAKYCSVACQQAAWPHHKPACLAARDRRQRRA
ncbi:hypothetical protein ABPG77_004096 [Micractinium sp. CCAP 211/92]